MNILLNGGYSAQNNIPIKTFSIGNISALSQIKTMNMFLLLFLLMDFSIVWKIFSVDDDVSFKQIVMKSSLSQIEHKFIKLIKLTILGQEFHMSNRINL